MEPLHPNKRVRVFFYVFIALLCLVLALLIAFMAVGDAMLGRIEYESKREDQMSESLNLQSVGEEDPADHEALPKVSLSGRPIEGKNGLINILLVGSDNQGEEINGRSDAMILCTINTNTRKIHMTSLMRAIYVSIPNDPDPELAKYWSPNHALNSAYAWGGSRLLVKTIKANFRVDVDKYVEVDFQGFTDVIDELGGVPLELTEAEAAHLNGIHGTSLTPGENLLDGQLALAYARIRKIDTDFVRTARQRNVLMSLFHKWKSASPLQLIKSANIAFSHLKTNFSKEEIVRLFLNMPSYMNYKMDQLMLPLEEGEAVTFINGKELYAIDWDSNIDALLTFMES